MGTLSQFGLQYLLPVATGHSHPGRAHFSAFFSAMIASSGALWFLRRAASGADADFLRSLGSVSQLGVAPNPPFIARF